MPLHAPAPAGRQQGGNAVAPIDAAQPAALLLRRLRRCRGLPRPSQHPSAHLWAIGRDPAAWEAPLEFRPERFLPGGAAEKVDPLGNYFELIPFGAGRRICAGKLAGMVFVQYFLGTLLHAFEWRLPEGEEKLDMAETFGLALPKAVPLRAVVTPRLVPEAYAA